MTINDYLVKHSHLELKDAITQLLREAGYDLLQEFTEAEKAETTVRFRAYDCNVPESDDEGDEPPDFELANFLAKGPEENEFEIFLELDQTVASVRHNMLEDRLAVYQEKLNRFNQAARDLNADIAVVMIEMNKLRKELWNLKQSNNGDQHENVSPV